MPQFDDWLYVETIRDLQRRVESRNRYDQLMIAPLVRKLISDRGDSLVMTVNRDRRLRISYRKPRYEFDPPKGPYPNGLYGVTIIAFADTGDWATSELVDRDKFLKAPVGEFEGRFVTVLELVRYFSHVEGGVHVGKPKSALEIALRSSLDAQMPTAITWVGALVPLGQAVLDGLEELTIDATKAVGQIESHEHIRALEKVTASPTPLSPTDWSLMSRAIEPGTDHER